MQKVNKSFCFFQTQQETEVFHRQKMSPTDHWCGRNKSKVILIETIID